jgi:hypothetical protein
VKRKAQCTGLRPSGCDRSTVLAGARCRGRPAPGAAESRCTGETKKAAQRLFGNQALTLRPVTPLSPPPRHLQAKTDASVPIRLLIPTPAQWVRHMRATRTGTGALSMYPEGGNGGRSTPGTHSAVPTVTESAPRVKRKAQRTAFRQSGCDRSMILSAARCGARPAVGAAESRCQGCNEESGATAFLAIRRRS